MSLNRQAHTRLFKDLRLSFIFILLMAIQAHSKDIVYTRDGEEFYGDIKFIDADSLILGMENGDTLFPLSEVVRVEFLQNLERSDWKTTDDITDPLLAKIVSKYLGKRAKVSSSYEVLFEEKCYILYPDSSSEFVWRRISRVFNDDGIDREGSHSVYFFPDNDTAKLIFAIAISPDGTITPISQNSIEYSSPYGWVSQYDRVKRLKFALGGLVPGSIVDFKLKIAKRKVSPFDPFAGSEIFAEDAPVEKKIVRIRVPDSFNLNYHISGRRDLKVKLLSSAGMKEYVFTRSNCEPVISEPMMPPLVHIAPGLFFSVYSEHALVASLIKSKFDESTLGGLAAQGIVDSIKRLSTSPGFVARCIYNWIVSNFRIVDVPFYFYHPYPKGVEELFSSRIANGFDAAFVYYSLLRFAGIDADFLLVRTSDNGYIPEGISYINMFSEPIVSFNADSNYLVFVKSPYYNFGELPSYLREKPALSIKTGTIVRTKSHSQDENYTRIYLSAEIDSALELRATKKAEYFGSSGASAKVRAYSKMEELLQEESVNLSFFYPEVSVDSLKVTGRGLDSIVSFEYSYRADDFLISGGEKYFALPIPEFYYTGQEAGVSKKRYELFLPSPQSFDFNIRIKLPRNLVPVYIPQSASFDREPFGFGIAISYDSSTSIITMHIKERIDAGLYPKEKFSDFKEFAKLKLASTRKWIILEKQE